MGIPTAAPSAPGVTRYKNESDSSYFARVAAANAAAKAAAVKQAQAAAAAAAAKQKSINDLVAKTYPNGLPSWVAANGLTPAINANTGELMFHIETPDYKANYSTSGQLIDSSNNNSGLNPLSLLPIALSFVLPGVGSAIGGILLDAGIVASEVAANVIGTAIANTAVNVAQGQNLETAIKNSVVNAAINTGSIPAAQEVNAIIGHPAVADAIVSAGASAVKTAAAGGTEQDIATNMTAALAGSAASSAYNTASDSITSTTGRVIGSSIAGAITGGTTGAITGAIGELGTQSKGKVAGAIENVFSPSDTGALPASQVAAMTPTGSAGALADVTVTGQRPTDITNTNIISPSSTTDQKVLDLISASKSPNAVLKPVTVTATKPKDITSTDIIEPPALEPVTVTGTKENVPLTVAEQSVAAAEETVPSEQYNPNLFIVGGVKPKPKTPTTAPKTSTATLSQALGTTTGLTASRGAGEIEDPSTGKKRKQVWNEETLRLKDALGV